MTHGMVMILSGLLKHVRGGVSRYNPPYNITPPRPQQPDETHFDAFSAHPFSQKISPSDRSTLNSSRKRIFRIFSRFLLPTHEHFLKRHKISHFQEILQQFRTFGEFDVSRNRQQPPAAFLLNFYSKNRG